MCVCVGIGEGVGVSDHFLVNERLRVAHGCRRNRRAEAAREAVKVKVPGVSERVKQ